MNATSFQAALDTVEQDHRMVLDKMQALKDVVSCVLNPEDTNPHQILERLQGLNDYFATQFASHMEEEETTLFPLLEQQGAGGSELVAHLRAEHGEILRKREELGNCLAVASGLEDHLPRAVLRDLLGYAWELWELLDHHAHAETRAVHRCLARSLLGDVPAQAESAVR
jgi:iron-sulfur cluster repair protein YtfE (RIC family)